MVDTVGSELGPIKTDQEPEPTNILNFIRCIGVRVMSINVELINVPVEEKKLHDMCDCLRRLTLTNMPE